MGHFERTISRGTAARHGGIRRWAGLAVLALLPALAIAHPVDLTRTNVFSDAQINESVGIGDINGDTNPDIVVAVKTVNASAGVAAQFSLRWFSGTAWSANTPLQTWTSEAPGGVGFQGDDQVNDILVADVNADGLNDVVVCTNLDGTFWFRQTSPLVFAAKANIYSVNPGYENARQIAVGDVNANGTLDIVTAVGESGASAGNPNANSLLVYSSNGGGANPTFTNVNYQVGANGTVTNAQSVRLGNLNGDGKLEATVAYYTLNQVYWFNHGAADATANLVTVGALSTTVTGVRDTAMGDFNGDGFRDIAAIGDGGAGGGAVVLRYYQGTGGSSAANFANTGVIDTRPTNTGVGGSSLYLQAVDFDDDGDTDILATYAYRNEFVFFDNIGAPTNTFSFTPRVYDNSSAAQIQVGPRDFKASVAVKTAADDTWLDLAILANGNVSFYNNTTYTNGPTYTSATVTNGDAGTSQIQLAFNKKVAIPDITGFTVSGPGLGTATGLTLASANPGTDTLWNLSYSNGAFVDGQNITVAISNVRKVTDNDGATPDGAHVVGTLSRTAANRQTNSIPGAWAGRYYTTDSSFSITAVPGGGPAQGAQTFAWRRNGTPVANGGGISNATTATITLASNYLVGPDGGATDVWTNRVGDSRPETVDASITLESAPPVSIVTDPVGGLRTVTGPLNDISMNVAATGGYPGYTYQWFGPSGALTNGVNGSGTTVAGATSDTLTLTDVHVPDGGNYYVVVTDSYGGPVNPASSAQSANAVLVVDNNLIVYTDPVGGEFYSGDTVTLEIEHSGGTGPYSYQWIDADSNIIPGSPDAPTWTITGILVSQSGSYRALVSDSLGDFAISNEAILDVVPAVDVVTQPVTGHANTGGSYQFTVVATGGYPPYNYDWFKVGNAVPLQSGPSATFLLSGLALSDTGNYYVVVTDTNTPIDSSDTSANANLLVTDLLSVVLTTPTGTGIPGLVSSTTNLTDVYNGNSFTLSVTPSGGSTPYTYLWQIDYGTGFVNAPGVNTNQTYSVASAGGLNDGVHRCVVADSSPDPNVSASIDIGVFNNLFITTPPQNTTVNVTDTANFTVLVSGGIPPITYNWRKGGTPLGAPSQNTLAYGPVVYPGDNGATFDVIVDDAVAGASQTSNPVAVLTVTNNIAVTLDGDKAAYLGDTVVLTSLVGGGNGNFTYEWTRNGNPVSNGGTISGADTDTLTITGAIAGDAGTYALTVEDDSGVNAPDSDQLNLTVTAHVNIITDPANLSRYEGAPATFSVVISGGIGPITYDWRESGGSLGAPSQNSYVIPAVALGDDGNTYDVVVTESASDFSAGTPQTSATATLNVAAPLTVTGPVPASVQAYTTDPAFPLEVTPAGGFGAPTFQWYVVVPNVGPVPAPGYTFNPQLVDPGSVASLLGTGIFSVFCVVTDAGGSVTSGNATIEIVDELSIVDGLEDTTANEGSDFVWGITVAGGLSPITYQWSRDVGGAKAMEIIPGENNSTLELDNLGFDDAGEYLVEVTDGGTGAVSSQATLTVVKGVPVAGLLGMSLLTLTSALGGAMALRRRK